MNVENRVYEISKLISDSKEGYDGYKGGFTLVNDCFQDYVDTDTVFNVMSLYPQVMPKDKEPVKVQLSSLYGKFAK
jgi:hypothetical protein